MYLMEIVGYTLSDCKRNEEQTANSINNVYRIPGIKLERTF
jgi:hypothetical protein